MKSNIRVFSIGKSENPDFQIENTNINKPNSYIESL